MKLGKILSKKSVLYFVLGFLGIVFLTLVFSRPSNDRDWAEDQEVLGRYSVEGDLIFVENIRNFTYRNTSDFDIEYYNKSFNLSELSSLDYIVEPFSGFVGAAHTFVSFGFGDEYLAISVEIRKEKGESFSAIKGLLKKYEIMYVLGDERDLVGLRAIHRKDEVFIYPINTTREKMRMMLVSMLDRANFLSENPEYYNTLTNTCTTNLYSHVNIVTPGRLPFSYKVLFPEYSDELAYDQGLIDTDLEFEEIRDYFKINERAVKYENSSDFSVRIRDYDA